MKINYELLFFIIKSRLFASLSFSLPLSVEGGASPFLLLLEKQVVPSLIPAPPCPFQTSTLPLVPPPVPSWVWRPATAVLLKCCRISSQNDATSEGTSAFCCGSTKPFCTHHISRGPSPALHGCTGKLRVRWQVKQFGTLRSSASLK